MSWWIIFSFEKFKSLENIEEFSLSIEYWLLSNSNNVVIVYTNVE